MIDITERSHLSEIRYRVFYQRTLISSTLKTRSSQNITRDGMEDIS